MATAPTVVAAGDRLAVGQFRAKLRRSSTIVLRHPGSLSRSADIAVVAMDGPERVSERVGEVAASGVARHIVVVAVAGSLDGLLAAAAAGADGWMSPAGDAATWTRTLEGVLRGESGFSRVDAMKMLRASRSMPSRPVLADAADMTPRERQIHQLSNAGITTREIARRLNIAEGTVRWHAARAQKKAVAAAASPATADRVHGSGHPDLRPAIPLQRTARPSKAPQFHEPRPVLASLSRAESRVALLVAEGLSNPEVAAELFVSRHTVESHLKQIFVKLAIRSRVELTRRVLGALPSRQTG